MLSAFGQYVDISQSAAIDYAGKQTGVSAGDFDYDGDDDLYVCVYDGPNRLFQNQGNGRFLEVAYNAGLAYPGNSTCSVWGDLDNDGDLDLYVANRNEPNLLFENDGSGSFKNIAETAGVNSRQNPRACLLADVNQDGWLDIYVANLGRENALFINQGNMRFQNEVQLRGATDEKISMGAIFFDYDNDRDLDLYLTHDANQANILYQNDGNGYFTDVSAESKTDIAAMGMGVDVGDMNRDGWLDIYITNFADNTLLKNLGNGQFEDISQQAGVGDLGMGWGTTFIDFDNDGWLDIYVANDSYFSPFPNVLYRNKGDEQFEKVELDGPVSSMAGSYGIAKLDLNLDGYLDLFVANYGPDGNQLFLNQYPTHHNWLSIRALKSTKELTDIGARIELTINGKQFIDEIRAGSGYCAQNSANLYFGLGLEEQVDQLRIYWSDGSMGELGPIESNRTVLMLKNLEANPDLANWLSIAPNPIQQQAIVEINLSEPGMLYMQLINSHGQITKSLYKGHMTEGKYPIILDLGDVLPGMYILEASINDKLVQKKVLLH